jgi:hypothetical protein
MGKTHEGDSQCSAALGPGALRALSLWASSLSASPRGPGIGGGMFYLGQIGNTIVGMFLIDPDCVYIEGYNTPH